LRHPGPSPALEQMTSLLQEKQIFITAKRFGVRLIASSMQICTGMHLVWEQGFWPVVHCENLHLQVRYRKIEAVMIFESVLMYYVLIGSKRTMNSVSWLWINRLRQVSMTWISIEDRFRRISVTCI
jgi:hypothetical protein